MGHYVIYARKSTDSEDRQILSIDSQVRELRQLARKHDVAVSEVLTESYSAKAPGRPVFNQLMDRVERGKIAGLLCWKIDRLFRNHLDQGRVLQALADGKLEQVITSDGVKTRDGNDRLMVAFEGAMATKFIDDLRANVKRGNRARFEQGWPNHLPPIGYLNDKATKTIVKDPERFALVRRMWDCLLSGERPKEIARKASRDWGLLSPRRGRIGGNPITYSSTYKMFRNSFYAGYNRLKDGRQYLGAHEPMITAAEFEQAQTLLRSRVKAGPVVRENPYAGLIRCGNCGCSIVAEVHEKLGRTYTYHRCSRMKRRVVCREKPISQAALLQQFATYFNGLAIPEPILAWLRKKLDTLELSNAQMSLRIREQRQRALQALEREERELLGMRMRQLVSDEEFHGEREALHRRRQDLEEGLADEADVTPARQERADAVANTLDLVHGAPFVLAQGDPVQIRGMLQQLDLKLELRGRRLDFTVQEPLFQLVRAGSDSNWCATWPEIWNWIMYGTALPWISPKLRVHNLD